MDTATKKYYDLIGKHTAEALKKHHFDAVYCFSRQEVYDHLLTWIPADHTVSWGGSQTLQELGVPAFLREHGIATIDRETASTPEERQEMMRQALLCDTFLMSSNAISEDGQLFNIDGIGNRVAALIYGPKSVIVVAGMNKVVRSIEDAERRARNLAAPMNMQRFSDDSKPCYTSGLCGNCFTPNCGCAQMVTTRVCRPGGRIKVILVGEELGF